MNLVSNAADSPLEYRFGIFRLIPAVRELWRDDQPHHVQPLVFDCLVYLLEHRQRVVGRDELASAVWASVDVGDQQIRQLVLRARQAIGDDAKAQRIVRTVPGGGYRWVSAVEVVRAPAEPPAATATDPPASPLPDTAVPDDPVTIEPPPPPPSARMRRRRWWPVAVVIGLGVVVALWQVRSPRAPPTQAGAAPGDAAAADADATVVLPFDVSGPDEAGWIRLGAMDLVAQRMRSAGMRIPPSDSVVSAVHVVGALDEPARLARLKDALGARSLVRGSARKTGPDWVVRLDVVGPAGAYNSAEATRPDPMQAALAAADLLASALGHVAPAMLESPRELDESLQRAQAALLANQVETADAVLAALPESLQNHPLVRAKRAQVQFRAGRLGPARQLLGELIADPAAADAPLALGQALTTLGFIEVQNEAWPAAEQHFTRAVSILETLPSSRELGIALAARGLARSGLHRYEDATADLSRAGYRLQEACDRLGVARVGNYFGQMEMARNRPAQAAGYFEEAARAAEPLGVVEVLRSNLWSLCAARAQLLQWPDALAACDRVWALRERLQAPADRLSIVALRAKVLLAMGRFHEVQQMFAQVDAAADEADAPARAGYRAARAHWLVATGRLVEAVAEAGEALASWPPHGDERERLLLDIACRHAAAALGREDCPATGGPAERVAEVGPTSPPLALVAFAERAARDRPEAAELAFRQAVSAAEAVGVPDDIVYCSLARARWLFDRGRTEEADEAMGRLVVWSDRDFTVAFMQAQIAQRLGRQAAWANALRQARALAGDRVIPPPLTVPPQGPVLRSPPAAAR